jgi:hypothetical protein
MTQVHGKKTRVLYNGLDLSGDFNSFDRQGTVDTVNTSTYGLEDHKFIAGMATGIFNWNFIYSDATPNAEANMIIPDFASETPKQGMLIFNNVSGSRAFASDKCVITSYAMSSSVSDAVKGSGAWQTQDGLRGGALLHALGMTLGPSGNSPVDQQSFGQDTITSSSVANPTVITCPTPHGLVSGDVVSIQGHTGSTPTINSTYAVTVISPTTFSIPIQVTVAGTGGTLKRISSTGGRLYVQTIAVQGTLPTLNILVEDSIDGTVWATIDTVPVINAVGTVFRAIVGNIREFARISWTIGGSATPGFDFAALLTRNNRI